MYNYFDIFPCCDGFAYIGIPGPQGPKGDTGPMGPQGEPGTASSGLEAYGGLYNSSSQLPAITAVNTYVQLSLNTPMPLKSVTTGANSITTTLAGDYEINYNLLVSTSKAADIGVVVRNNGTAIAQTRVVQTLATDDTTGLSYDGRLTCTTIVTLPANSVLDLGIAVLNTLPDNLDMAINGNGNATLSIKKIN